MLQSFLASETFQISIANFRKYWYELKSRLEYAIIQHLIVCHKNTKHDKIFKVHEKRAKLILHINI